MKRLRIKEFREEDRKETEEAIRKYNEISKQIFSEVVERNNRRRSKDFNGQNKFKANKGGDEKEGIL